MYKRLTKSSDSMLSGVCGGIADFFEIDPTLVRVGYATLTVFNAVLPGIILYIILSAIMPKNELQ